MRLAAGAARGAGFFRLLTMVPTATEWLGYAAAGLVLATFSARSLTTLRSVAIASNLMFIAYAASADLLPVLILHAMLLPLNGMRLLEALRLQPQSALAPTARACRASRGQRRQARRRDRRRPAWQQPRAAGGAPR